MNEECKVLGALKGWTRHRNLNGLKTNEILKRGSIFDCSVWSRDVGSEGVCKKKLECI